MPSSQAFYSFIVAYRNNRGTISCKWEFVAGDWLPLVAVTLPLTLSFGPRAIRIWVDKTAFGNSSFILNELGHVIGIKLVVYAICNWRKGICRQFCKRCKFLKQPPRCRNYFLNVIGMTVLTFCNHWVIWTTIRVALKRTDSRNLDTSGMSFVAIVVLVSDLYN